MRQVAAASLPGSLAPTKTVAVAGERAVRKASARAPHPFSAKRGRWPKAGWGAESRYGPTKVRGDGRAIRLGPNQRATPHPAPQRRFQMCECRSRQDWEGKSPSFDPAGGAASGRSPGGAAIHPLSSVPGQRLANRRFAGRALARDGCCLCWRQGPGQAVALRQSRELFADRVLGAAQLIKLLQIHPEPRTGPEPMSQAQRRVGGDAALAVDDAGDPVDGNLDLPRAREANFG